MLLAEPLFLLAIRLVEIRYQHLRDRREKTPCTCVCEYCVSRHSSFFLFSFLNLASILVGEKSPSTLQMRELFVNFFFFFEPGIIGICEKTPFTCGWEYWKRCALLFSGCIRQHTSAYVSILQRMRVLQTMRLVV
jgi:hypothetical protein